MLNAMGMRCNCYTVLFKQLWQEKVYTYLKEILFQIVSMYNWHFFKIYRWDADDTGVSLSAAVHANTLRKRGAKSLASSF